MSKVTSSEVNCYAGTCDHWENGCTKHPEGQPFEIGAFGRCRDYTFNALKTVKFGLCAMDFVQEGEVKPA